MTKDEYHKLLKSDYWKGFSYSIIKERNFTCEDCGAYYPKQRNKLEVHHLVYRDIAPWSYKPEEMVVLCENCHKKRHGIYVYKPKGDSFKAKINIVLLNVWYKIKHRFKRIRFRRILFFILIIGIAFFFSKFKERKKGEIQENTEVNIEHNDTHDKKRNPPKAKKNLETKETIIVDETGSVNHEIEEEKTSSEEDDFEVVEAPASAEPVEDGQVMTKKETRKHAKAIKKAIKEGVSTEGTTEEILERIEQAKVAKKAAKKAPETMLEE